MSFLKKIFGGGSGEEVAGPSFPSETYEGFVIQPTPMPADGGQFRLAADISKSVGGEEKTHRLIRADLFPSADAAAAASMLKAHQVIDEQGDDLF